MDSFVTFLCQYAHETPWIIFCLLLLTGFNIPISEDLLIILAGAIVSICIPDHYFKLFFWVYAGALLSAWIAYWIGRLFGEKLYSMRWFKHVINKDRIEKLHEYYEKYGVLVFIVGRFCPGGIRNALFMTSGLGKMPFYTFILRDAFACLISTSVLFNLGYYFGIHYKKLLHWLKTYDLVGIAFLSALIIVFLLIRLLIKKYKL